MGCIATYHPDVKAKDLPKINEDIRKRIKNAIETPLQTDPYSYGQPLRKTLKGYRKMRVGDYRVVYKATEQSVVIYCICHRKDVYEIAAGRGDHGQRPGSE